MSAIDELRRKMVYRTEDVTRSDIYAAILELDERMRKVEEAGHTVPLVEGDDCVVALQAWERFYRNRPIESTLAEHEDAKALLLYTDAVQRTQWALGTVPRPNVAANPTREEAVP